MKLVKCLVAASAALATARGAARLASTLLRRGAE